MSIWFMKAPFPRDQKNKVLKNLLVLALIFSTGSPAVAGRLDGLLGLSKKVKKNRSSLTEPEQELVELLEDSDSLRLMGLRSFQNMDSTTAAIIGETLAGEFTQLRKVVSFMGKGPASPKILKELMAPSMDMLKEHPDLVRMYFADILEFFYEVDMKLTPLLFNKKLVRKSLEELLEKATRRGEMRELIIQLNGLSDQQVRWFGKILGSLPKIRRHFHKW